MARPHTGLQIAANPSGHQSAESNTAPAHLARGVKEVLVVEPDPQLRRAAQEALRSLAVVETCSDFRDARARLFAKRPDLLVTNIRLANHNGLHLVHLAAAHTLCIVYGTDQDLPLAREAQAAGAFFVSRSRLADAVQSFVVAELPTRDRRDPTVVDRRTPFRGGRRCIDR
jgi:DNA-binding NtrC family response regulator